MQSSTFSNGTQASRPTPRPWLRTVAALGLSAVLAACAGLQPPGATSRGPDPAGVIAPNANLLVQGIPPIPASLAAQVDKYTDFRGHGFVTWHPTKPEMIVTHRAPGSSVTHLFRLAQPLGRLEPLTEGPDPVSSAHYEPKEGRFLIYARATGGNEVSQLYRLDLPSRQSTLLTNPDERHAFETWFSKSGRFLFSSVPLDRTARGGTRTAVSTVLRTMDPMDPSSVKTLAELPGTGWNAGTLSKDEKTLTINRYISANESQVWLMDVDTGQRRQVLPEPGSTVRGVHAVSRFLPDGSGLLVATDRFGEFRELATFDFKTSALKRITGHIPWDVAGAAMSYDGKLLAA
ncbi:MAG: S9 family peptidase, partial [Betaproteobacteria bacterium]|nr:S9 family peptidase [Betaproteobacteria bacterium]